MTPLYSPGDYVFCHRLFRPPQPGDIVIAKTTNYGMIIKKVASINSVKRTVRLQGIHWESVDSIQIGDIPFEQILWKVLFSFP